MDSNVISQLVATALLSSGFVGGILTIVNKRSWSPESRNELHKMGSEFAQQLLKDARSEREELRTTIKELQGLNEINKSTILKLSKLSDEKDDVIEALEQRQIIIANRVKNRQVITLRDVFGDSLTDEMKSAFSPS